MSDTDREDFDPGMDRQDTLADQLNLQSLIAGLVEDLQKLRDGRISVQDARARAELARQIMRGVHFVVTARKFIESQARLPRQTPGEPE